jgi:hypothetical protein
LELPLVHQRLGSDEETPNAPRSSIEIVCLTERSHQLEADGPEATNIFFTCRSQFQRPNEPEKRWPPRTTPLMGATKQKHRRPKPDDGGCNRPKRSLIYGSLTWK